ncbi:MAG: antibiotic biosynthesis monooxygenase [Bacteroides sp.]|nr:antibiotic biosynthesis monooxygenase [Bacteroides sp.]MDE7462880.1 antibiotic biosynthesis monooxygenase [Muribaculaceae bacterium]
MIRLNVSMIVETEENAKKLKEAALELVAFSLKDKGCIDYDLYRSKSNNDRYMIVETWESEEALKAHTETEHYKRLSPELNKYSNLTVEKFDF